MAPHDLHWRIWNLRDLVGDKGRKRGRRLVENRRGEGYFLNLPEGSVEIVHRLPDPVTEEPIVPAEPVTEQVIHLDEPAPPTFSEEVVAPVADEPSGSDLAPVSEGPPVAASETPRRSVRPRAVLIAATIALAALVSSWSVGYLLANGPASDRTPGRVAELPTDVPPKTEASEPKEKERESRKKEQGPKRKKRDRKDRSNGGQKEGGSSGPVVVAAAPSEEGTGSGAPAPQQQEPSSSGSAGSDKDNAPQPAPALPTAPTRFLYHLVHSETGDHFVTTDGSAASEYEAKGYAGAAIGRVYISQEERTKAISTNQGTAWVFIDRAPKTEPASQVVALWYSTDNAGDFFYTTSESEARATGWSASLVGYIRTM